MKKGGETLKSNVQLRQKNMKKLLTAIVESGPVSKRELQEILGLSWGTISTLTNELIEKEYVNISGKQSTNSGRKPEVLDISQNFLFVGIDFNHEGIVLVVTDMKGRTLYKSTKKLEKKEYNFALITLFNMIDKAFNNFPNQKIVAIAFGMQGVINAEKGISVLIKHIKGWNDVPLKKIVEERYKTETILIHDPDCLMETEKTFGVTGVNLVRNALLIRSEKYGVGMSIMIDEKPYLGTNGMAGEIGRVLVDPSANKDYPFLDRNISVEGIIEKYCDLTGDNSQEISIDEIAEKAKNDEKNAADVFKWVGYNLGWAIVTTVNLFDPELVIICGEMSRFSELFADEIKLMIKKYAYNNKIQIKRSNLGDDACAIGAALISADKNLSKNIYII